MHATTLETAFCRDVSDFLGTDLRDVRVLLPQADEAPALSGVAGCLNGEHIWLRRTPDVANLSTRTVLVHELAHVAQKRAGRGRRIGAGLTSLEAQARDAEQRFAAGLPMPPLLPATGGGMLHWGWPGHYYTTYLVALGAGICPSRASSYAFFAQLADQVAELDAIEAGKNYIGAQGKVDWDKDIAVAMGLHTLTGHNAIKETSVRTKIVREFINEPFACGLAIHAFGDSYSHRRMDGSGLMYKAPAGHLEDMHDPDLIQLRHTQYSEYVETLYQIFKHAADGDIKMPLGNLLRMLLEVSRYDDEKSQCNMMRNMSQTMGVQMVGYQPELSEAIPFAEFSKRYGQMLDEKKLHYAIRLGRNWLNRSAAEAG